MDKTIIQQIEEIANDLCLNYCYYSKTWDEEKEGVPLADSEVCENCPLCRLS